MSEPLLTVLKLCLLALLYLFFLRVLRAVWVEIKPPADAEEFLPEKKSRRRGRRRRSARVRKVVSRSGQSGRLVVVEPLDQEGRSYPVEDEVTLGRAAGCSVTVDDDFVSQLHARIYRRDGQVMVEDLGSTNGTYLNRRKVSGPMVMQLGDRLQVGNTVLELA